MCYYNTETNDNFICKDRKMSKIELDNSVKYNLLLTFFFYEFVCLFERHILTATRPNRLTIL